MAPEEA
jgi:hypothetical protein